MAQKKSSPVNPVLVIHGGAGTIFKSKMTTEKERAYREKLEEALNAGFSVLKRDGTALDAVETAIKIMEDSPLFNAGKGSVFTSDGKNEMDAAIMDGKTLKAGAVAAVSHIKNPIVAARAVMEKTQHVLLIGDGAELFAKKSGVEMVDSTYFFDERRWEQFKKAKQEEPFLDHDNDTTGYNSKNNDSKFGTVGAVAIDSDGNLAAATSTGGMTNKKFGRVGDSPIIGAGTYANNKTCAVSATGHGEYFIRGVMAYDISALMEYQNFTVEKAAEKVIMEKLSKIGGTGGVIAIDAKGNVAMPFNTEGMYRGIIQKHQKPKVLIYKDVK